MSGPGNTMDLLSASVSLSVCGFIGILPLPPPPLQGLRVQFCPGRVNRGEGRGRRDLFSFAEEETAQSGEGTCPKSHSR